MAKKNCIKCGVKLNKKNWSDAQKRGYVYICLNCEKDRVKLARRTIKLEIIEAYGGECACCQCDIPDFLSIDHIDGNGAEHRRQLGQNKKKQRTGVAFYRWLKQNGFPKDNFQLLCFNCNFAKHICGVCPHQTKE